MEEIKIYCDGVLVYREWKQNTARIDLFKMWLYREEENVGQYPDGDFFCIFNKSQTKKVILNRNRISAVIFER